MRITVIGGTGYAGAAIVAEAAARGHEVTAVSRGAAVAAVDGVRYVQGSALDAAVVQHAVAGADAIVAAASPRGDMAGACSRRTRRSRMRPPPAVPVCW